MGEAQNPDLSDVVFFFVVTNISHLKIILKIVSYCKEIKINIFCYK